MRAAVFDFDGVLVNSEPLHYRALRQCLLGEGIAIDEEEYAEIYLAHDDRTAIRLALERHAQPSDPARVDALAGRKAAIFDELIAQIPYFPGAAALVRALSREVPLAIASGALRREIERILTAGGLRDAFVCIVGADDVVQGKPHPEPYLTALRGLARVVPHLEPRECLVIEDSMPGIASALAAGMRVLAVAHSYPPERLSAAHLVVNSFEALGVERLRALFE